MQDPELARRLSDLGARIAARRREFATHGEFDRIHAQAFADVEARRIAVEARMEQMVARGNLGQAAVLEIGRDVDAVVDLFESILFDVDARARRGVA